MELTEAFYVFFVSSILACLGLGMRTLYKSKCVRFSCCGIMVERDVVGEERIDNIQLQRVNSQENNI
jgi:hypothetical protein